MRWLILLVVFSAGEVVDTKILAAKSAQECADAAAKIDEMTAKSAEVQFWRSDCMPMQTPMPPKFKKENES